MKTNSLLKRKTKFDVFYTMVVVFYPLLSSYSFFNSSLSIADIFGLLVSFLMLFKLFEERVSPVFAAITIFLFFHTCIMLIVNSSTEGYATADLIGTTLRLLLVYFLLSLAGKHFDFNIGKRTLVIISAVATLYLFLQLALSFGGIYIEGGIPFLNQWAFREDLTGYIEDVIEYGLAYRPRSIFEEPAHYCQYVIVGIVLLLFDQSESYKKSIPCVLLLAFGIVFSMSLLGWLALAIVALFWIIVITKKNKSFVALTFFFLIAPIVLIVLWQTEPVRQVIENKFLNQDILSDPRFGGVSVYEELVEQGRAAVFFGNGLVATEVYYNGIARLLYSFGFVGVFGTSTLAVLWIYKYRRNVISIVLILLLAILSFGSEIIFGKFILIYLAFLQMQSTNENDKAIVI